MGAGRGVLSLGSSLVFPSVGDRTHRGDKCLSFPKK